MDISKDIHVKSVHIDEKFDIHGKPENFAVQKNQNLRQTSNNFAM